jgi:sec-independent protein translocase protein TatA
MGPIGVQEMIGIFLIALLLFGPKKLPELGRTLGKALSEFRRAKNEFKSTFESHLHELERETRVELPPIQLDSASDYSASRYTDPYEDRTPYSGSSDPYSSNSSPYGSTSSPHEESAASYVSEPASAEPASPPVQGTVARTNGTHPVTPVSVPTGEDHPA